jgi:AraC-like DNA-binding protein
MMSMMRQEDAIHSEPPVRGYAVTHPPGVVTMPTQPGWQQVVYALSGVVRAIGDREAWTLPPHRALCIGDDRRIELSTPRRTAIRTLYVHRSLEALAPTVRIVTVPPLARELLLRAVETAPLDLGDERSAALCRLLFAELDELSTVPLHLPLPTDGRARLLADAIVDSPSASLADLLGDVPAARRTCERLFLDETGLTLAGWQRRSRVLEAIELLERGSTVTTAAATVGYATPSSFVVAFRSETGATPTAFLAPALE